MGIPTGWADPWTVIFGKEKIDGASQFKNLTKFMETRIVVVVSMEWMRGRRACRFICVPDGYADEHILIR